MSVHLRGIRLYVTTKDEPDAGTDSGVELHYFTSTARLHGEELRSREGWQVWNLNNPGNDRERGQTDLYEISLEDLSDVGKIVGGLHIPPGVAFRNFAEVRLTPFYLRIKGDDWWKIESYMLYGWFQEVREPIPTGGIQDWGWLQMAERTRDVELSTDDSEGSRWHQICITGTLNALWADPPELEPATVVKKKE